LDLLQTVGALVATLRGPWIIGGDWQCTPDDLKATGWLQTVKGVIHAPAASTCGDRIIDFFVVSACFSQAVVATCVIGDGGFKPHSPVRLIVKSDARSLMVRQLKVPVGFGAESQHGPLPRQRCPRALLGHDADEDDCTPDDLRTIEELGKDYEGLVKAIEREMCIVEGLEGVAAEARKGRSLGAKYCWKTAVGDDTKGAAKTTSASRAWRKTATWLGEVIRTKSVNAAESARWRIRFYRHPKPDPAQATHEQAMSRKVFDDWRGCIQAEQLHNRTWLDMLKHVAEQQADKEEAAAQLANIRNYREWLEGGTGKGLRRQHQFTRNATGWTETALCKDSGNGELGEHDDLDGLSEMQIAAINDKVCHNGSPADVQSECNDQANAWREVWEATRMTMMSRCGRWILEPFRR
jgi:hypothetical protein